jgi:hypothetical protein
MTWRALVRRLATASVVTVATLAIWGTGTALAGDSATGTFSGTPSSTGPFYVLGTNNGTTTLYNVAVLPVNGLTVVSGSCSNPMGGTYVPNGDGSGSGECNFPSGIPVSGAFGMYVNFSAPFPCLPATVAIAQMTPPYTSETFPWSGGSCPVTAPNTRTVADAAAVLSALVGVDPRDPATAIGTVTNPTAMPLGYTIFLDSTSLKVPKVKFFKGHRVVVGSSRGTIPAGQTEELKATVSKKGLRLLKQHTTLKVKISLDLSDSAGHHKTFSKNSKLKLVKKKSA